ncbi:peptidylprolyl isomerase [Wenzhouxiangella marina]|uniref:Chaperone SurA n=1 Tax=Wenzhouxiangella marina TaxID=1579979 RepID=A0A0K0XZ30_9GAMM|nr:peptidylprolyl isomerase [Wenzhouxiangella marina]AKS42944.1 Chaperone SurA [Wenzhouxiangella marina]MBB6087372.1 peptidyl-prolyl cis-trans isomerase SurA [Wenzhouxiangella marina]
MNLNRNLAKLGLLALVLLPMVLQAQDGQPVDRIVALVEDDVILQSELDEAIDRIERQAAGSGERLPPRSVMEEQVLQRLILTRLEVLRAQDTGIRVSDSDVDQALQQVARQNNLTVTQLRQAIESDGVDFAEFRRTIREEILSSRLRQRVVNGMEEISDTEIDIIMASDRFGGDEYLLSQIVIGVPESADQAEVAQAEARANEVHQRLEDGLEFATAALTFSESPDALEGGEVGWRSINALPPMVADAIEAVGVGNFTEVLRSPSGFIILDVRDRRDQPEIIVREYQARHLMIRPNELITPEEAETRIRSLYDQLQAGADFGELAREHSMDETSANIGGLLDWFQAGAYGDEIQSVIDGLDPGETSEPFRTAVGWHLLRLEAERDADRTEEIQRAQARDMLFRQKAEEEVDRFLRRLRDESFVEERL